MRRCTEHRWSSRRKICAKTLMLMEQTTSDFKSRATRLIGTLNKGRGEEKGNEESSIGSDGDDGAHVDHARPRDRWLTNHGSCIFADHGRRGNCPLGNRESRFFLSPPFKRLLPRQHTRLHIVSNPSTIQHPEPSQTTISDLSSVNKAGYTTASPANGKPPLDTLNTSMSWL